MNESKISVRYAKAIIQQAGEDKILDVVKTNIDFINACIHEIPEFTLLLESPVIRTSEKQAIIKKTVGDQIHPLTLSFINLVFTNKREIYLGSIIRYFLYLFNKEMGIKNAVLITPSKLDESLRDKIVGVISKKLSIHIELLEQSDEKLLGGFILRIEDQQIDASVASQLSRIRKALTN